VPISNDNLEGSISLELSKINSFVISKVDRIEIINSDTFRCVDEIPIKLLKADTREPNQVIAIKKSKNEEFVGVISGKILIMNEQFTNQLFIFKKH